jgi:hypothetical protein
VALVSDAINRPAPRIISVIEDLARQLHPEAFSDDPGTDKTKSQVPPAQLSQSASLNPFFSFSRVAALPNNVSCSLLVRTRENACSL